MIVDLKKIKKNHSYKIKDEDLIFGGIVRMKKYKGMYITCFQWGINAYYKLKSYVGHPGVDFNAPNGTHLIAEKDITIIPYQYYDKRNGKIGYGFICQGWFLYHLQYKPKKTKFKKGELISKTGYTGYCIPAGIKGSHLHVDRKVNGKHIDVLQEIKYASSVSTHKPKNITIKKGTIVNIYGGYDTKKMQKTNKRYQLKYTQDTTYAINRDYNGRVRSVGFIGKNDKKQCYITYQNNCMILK